MSSVTAINVFIEVDGAQHIAILDPAMAPMFMGMLGACQGGQPDGPRITKLPPDVASHLIDLRRALLAHWKKPMEIQAATQEPKP
jgi:hypothetical protein